MKDLSNTKFEVANIGFTVRIKIPDVDRGRGNPRLIIEVVLKLTDDGFYQLGCNDSKINLNNTSYFLFFILYLFYTYLHIIITEMLKQLYSRSQFTVCSENLLGVEAISNESVTLRSVAIAQSLRTGQVFLSALVPTNVTQRDVFVEKKRSIVQL